MDLCSVGLSLKKAHVIRVQVAAESVNPIQSGFIELKKKCVALVCSHRCLFAYLLVTE